MFQQKPPRFTHTSMGDGVVLSVQRVAYLAICLGGVSLEEVGGVGMWVPCNEPVHSVPSVGTCVVGMRSSLSLWIEEHLTSLSLSEEAEGYLLGRAATLESIERLGFVVWEPSSTKAPSEAFRKRYGDRGEMLSGMITYPLRSPCGTILGFESRSMVEKRISEFRTPESAWNPVLVNTPESVRRMWAGGSVWVCEGVFDLLALELVVPPGDAVVATLRAGLSKRHVDFLARFCRDRVYMVYDNDDTGRKATLGWTRPDGKFQRGALDLLRRAGLPVIDFRYRGKDPGEVWSSGGLPKLRRVFVGERDE